MYLDHIHPSRYLRHLYYLFNVFLLKMECHCTDQTGLKLLSSSDPPSLGLSIREAKLLELFMSIHGQFSEFPYVYTVKH